ncbi:hypothetical protein [Prochlorococcus sp. MIT 1307]|uniref:hypothetical protein n=1 Tax=Prochlorococcus sp. MIT 1307 TaxID=3096219 RepID=UPI002A75F923|nr:hypothetical protein [Prochlorococcus sp. MIT 1307]
MTSPLLLYIYPWPYLLETLIDMNSDFISIDHDDNIQQYKQGDLIKQFKLNQYSMPKSNIELTRQVMNGLDSYSPIFSRWLHNGHFHENNKELYSFKVIRLIKLIEDFNIHKGFFPTGVSHHLDTYTFELALSLTNKKMIFLYAEAIGGRLLPCVQNGDISTKKRLNICVSNFSFDRLIDNLTARNMIQPRRTISQYIYNYFKTNLLFSIFYLTFRKIKRILARYYSKFFLNKHHSRQSDYFSESSLSDLQLVLNQKKFLDNYNHRSINLNELDASKKSLIVYSHYQPEATSFPESGRIYSHLHIISHLRSIGFQDVIYYKEHPGSKYFIEGGPADRFVTAPTRVGMNRSLEYNEQLINLNCKILPINSNLKDYHNFLPLTLTGSIALERALRGLHTLYTGYPWWHGLPGTINLFDLAHPFVSISDDWITPSQKLASEARSFLLKTLNNKTIENGLGVGIQMKLNTSIQFRTELVNLLKSLEESD